jgi:hypothetical protein
VKISTASKHTPWLPRSTLQQYFNYIMATSFSGGGSRSTWRERPTMGKQLANFITCGYESSAPIIFIFKEKQRQIQIQKHMTCIYNFTQTKYIKSIKTNILLNGINDGLKYLKCCIKIEKKSINFLSYAQKEYICKSDCHLKLFFVFEISV